MRGSKCHQEVQRKTEKTAISDRSGLNSDPVCYTDSSRMNVRPPRALPDRIWLTLFLRASTIITDYRSRILFPHHQARYGLKTETHKASALGHGRHGTIPIRISILLSRCSRCHSHLRCCLLPFLRCSSDLPDGRASPSLPELDCFASGEQG